MWENVDDSTPEKVNKPAKKSRQQYILETELEYPKELRKKHNKLLILVLRAKNRNAEKLEQKLEGETDICSRHQISELSVEG